MRDVTELVDRYVGVWNEPDPAARRRTIASLWSKDGVTLAKSTENCARGYEAIEARVMNAHQKWVRDAGFVFRSRSNVDTHNGVVKFGWEMVPAAGGKAEATGVNVFVLDDDGRIRVDYMFSDPDPAQP
jgi:hypothetical protein